MDIEHVELIVAPVEVNGPANIIMFLDIYKKQNPNWMFAIHTVDMVLKVEKEARDTVEYMKHLSNPSGIAWHTIKKGGE